VTTWRTTSSRKTPVLIAVNTLIGEVREIRAELDSLAKRVACIVGADERPGSPAGDGTPGA
jgi:hypothetical protein